MHAFDDLELAVPASPGPVSAPVTTRPHLTLPELEDVPTPTLNRLLSAIVLQRSPAQQPRPGAATAEEGGWEDKEEEEVLPGDWESKGKGPLAAEEQGEEEEGRGGCSSEAGDLTCAVCLGEIALEDLALVKGCDHMYCGERGAAAGVRGRQPAPQGARPPSALFARRAWLGLCFRGEALLRLQ